MRKTQQRKTGKGKSASSAKIQKSFNIESLATRFKKYFGYGEYEGKDTWFARNWWLFLALAGIFLVGLFMRSYFYYPMASDVGFSGNDPYYHKRVVDFIQHHHSHLVEDPMLNYPVEGVNPRPPVYNWFIAMFGIILSPIFGFNVQLCTNTIMYLAPSFWGALTIFPIYFLTKEMFGKKPGILAAFLMATMPSHIERSPAGFSDHDSIVVFFVVLSIFLLFRAFRSLKHKDWVKDWRSTNSIYHGFSDFFRMNQVAVYYSLLSGVALATIALTWKGFPYALVIIIIYYLLQLIFDRFRHVDSTGIFICTFLALFTSLAVSYPYYASLSFGTWSTPFYFVAAVVVIGILLIPTRDYPWIIVLPLGIVVATAGYLILAVIAPAAAEALITGQGYFVKTKLYSTIAEAQPPEFSRLIVSYAVLVFFLAIIGIVKAAFQVPKHWKKEFVFIVVWAIVAVYMAMSAVRFMFNATPVITVVAGWVLYDLVSKINIKSKVLIAYTLGLGLSMLLLAWWGVDHGFGEKYTWILFMGVIAMISVPIIMAVYDNYDKRPITIIIGGMMAVWTISVIVMLIVNEELSWGTFWDVLAENADTWFFGLAALGISIIPIVLLMAKKRYAFLHMGIFLSITLFIFGMRYVGSFDKLFTFEPVKVVFSHSILPLLILIFNLTFLYLDKGYRKETARKVLFIAMEIWILSFFFDPSPYAGLVTFGLLVASIYLLTPYRKSFKHKTEPMHVVIALFVALFVMVPHIWFAIDASLPYEKKYEMNDKVGNAIPDFLKADDASPNKYFGAFGHGFTSEYWRAAFEWLSEQDTELKPEDRPGFVSWWDYGFWCAYLGQHPTAADNFQFGYQFAGSFISSQNESEAVSLMIARTMEAGLKDKEMKDIIVDILSQDKYFGEKEIYESNVNDAKLNGSEKLYEMLGRPEKYVNEIKDDPEKYGRYLELLPGNARYAAVRGMLVPLGKDKIVDLMWEIESATDKCIRYFAVDYRLFPFSAQNTGIFYAPIKLADKDVGDFLEYMAVLDDGREVNMDELEEMIQEDPTIRERILEYKLKYTDMFYNSMFYRCYIGYSSKDLGAEDLGVPILSPTGDFRDNQNYFQPMQGWNMSHFKQVYKTSYYTPKDPENASFPDDFDAMNTIDSAELYQDQGGYQVSGLRQGAFFLKYYHGAYVRGKVRTDGEEKIPMPGVRVAVSDEYGVPHDECVTDENGYYNLTAPFGDCTLTVSKDGYEESDNVLFSKLIKTEKTVLNRTTITITDDQAMRRGDWIIEKDLLLKDAMVNGKLFIDMNSNGEFDKDEDSYVDEALVSINSKDKRGIHYDRTTDENGIFNFTEVLPATYGFTVSFGGRSINLTDEIEITSEVTEETKDIGIAPGTVSGNVTYINNSRAQGIKVMLLDNENGTVYRTGSNETGHFNFEDLLPGNYTISLDEPLYHRFERSFDLEPGHYFQNNLSLLEVVPVSGRIYFDRFSDGIDDEDGISNARMILTEEHNPTNVVVTVTDAEGRFSTKLPLGNYTAYVHYVMGDEHLAGLADFEFRAGRIYQEDMVLTRAARIRGVLSAEESLMEGQDLNLTKGVKVKFRGENADYDVPTNGSSTYTVYLPEGEYYISTDVFIAERFAVGGKHVVVKGGEDITADLAAKEAFPVQGFVFLDLNGDMNLTIGKHTHDIQNFTEIMRSMSPGEEPPTDPTLEGTEGILTRGDTRNDTDGGEGEENTDANATLPVGNETNETGIIREIFYENITPTFVDFKQGDMIYRTLANETGLFNILLPRGTHVMMIESNEVAPFTETIVVGKEEDLVFVPSIRARNISFNITLGVDRDYDGELDEGELLRDFEIEFIANSTGALNASFDFRKGVHKRASLLPGKYDVVYNREFILSESEVTQNLVTEISLPRGSGEMEFTFLVEETIRFSGDIVTSTGAPGINVTLKLNSTTSDEKLEVVGDESGHFDSFIPQGVYFVQARYVKDSVTNLLRTVLDVSPGNTPFDLIMGRAKDLEVTLYFDKDQDGTFENSEKLIDVPMDISGDIRTTHTTNYNGKISTSLLPDKEYTITVDHLTSDSSYRYTANHSFVMPDRSSEIYLSVMKYVNVKGDLYWDKNEDGKISTGERIAGGTIDFSYTGSTGEMVAHTDADGKWNAYLPVFYNNTRTYVIEITANGYIGRIMERNISTKSRTLNIDLEPQRLLYQGTVFKDSYDNGIRDGNESTVTGLTVSLTSRSDTGRNESAVSAADGSYELELLPGEYLVEALVKGDKVYMFHEAIDVKLGEDRIYDIALTRGEYVYGSISYVDSNNTEHRDVDMDENPLGIESEDGGLVRELDFADGYFETYLPHGDYNMEMKGITVAEYGMDMVYLYDETGFAVDELFEPLDLLLGKEEEAELEMTILETLEGEDFEATINQGDEIDLNLRIVNTGNVHQRLSISGKETPDDWKVNITPFEADIPIKGELLVKVNIKTSFDALRTNEMKIEANSVEGGKASVDLKIDTHPKYRLEVYSEDNLDRGFLQNETKSFDFAVKNTGNAGDEVRFYLKSKPQEGWNITMQGEVLNASGFVHKYAQDDEFKNLTLKVKAPNMTRGMGVFEIGVESNSLKKTFTVNATISKPDIMIEDVTFKNLDFQDENKNVTVIITVTTIFADVDGFNLTVYLDDEKVDEVAESIDGILQDKELRLVFDWNLSDKKGKHDIDIYVDEDDRISEKDDINNNHWSDTIHVGPRTVDEFNWRIVIAIAVVTLIVVVSLIIWKKKQVV